MSWRSTAVAAIAIVAGLAVSNLAVGYLVDWLWFSSLGYGQVFWTVFGTRLILFLTALGVTALVVGMNGWLASRLAPQKTSRQLIYPAGEGAPPSTPPGPHDFLRKGPALLVAGSALVAGTLIAAFEMTNWAVLLRFFYQAPYGQSDPIYGKDIGFYLFSLPAYLALNNWMLVTASLSFVVMAAMYWSRGHIVVDGRNWSIHPTAIRHGSILLGIVFIVQAWSYGLDRFLLLYQDNGVVVGAGYTDLHVRLPVLWLLIGLSIVAALVCWFNIWQRTYRLPLIAIALVLASSWAFDGIYPALFERVYVRPNELQLQKPYIERNIVFTRQAYGLNRFIPKPFPAESNLTFSSLQANQATIDNIRLWDWQPAMDTYAQLQEIRTYYKFHDVDVDRYWLDGAYRQVMLSARELQTALLPPNAQTWVNRHLLFTHGSGAVMSPVTRKSPEGLPVFYLQDVPPIATGGPSIEEPRIYFGELSDSYVVVKASTPEFDYPKGKDNVYASYAGADGIAVGGSVRRALFAWYFNDLNLMLTDYITRDSRILFRRNIQDRVQVIAPFLRLDRDPYLVISGGRLFWIQDAYTTSDYFPYSFTSIPPLPDAEFNYIRNAIKVVIDAYNGSVDFYVADPSDPIANTYQRIFPGLFKPISAMPQDLQRHIRYPEDLFQVQARVYRSYHMENPEVFYNREDLWQFPRQAADGTTAPMDPSYMIMRLPGEPQAEYILMLPMAPSQRENMIAWLAARCDPPHYGELIVYEFPKDKLVFGPFQIEARLNQNTAISQQLSLWNQMGSRVIRGSLHVIPVETSLLYVSPLYLRAEKGQIPELKRVIAAYGDQVVMEETLPDALAALFKPTANLSPLPEPETGSTSAGLSRAQEALDHYNKALERLRAGDWGGFGAELTRLKVILEEAARPADTR
ncbi:UPF0182 family protein [Microvirga sp. M2]|uniref:UPF0182 family membrane protein n=1 Tax=Microvirga sp. M2 TaxID=3073270 RepID=UPI0039C46C3C